MVTRAVRQHGTHARYVQGPDINDQPGKGCRCDPCRAANRDYERERSRRIEPAYVHAGPAREHVLWLSTQGVGHNQVVKRAGVSHGMVSKLLYGDTRRGTPPSRRIRRAAAERILAVMPSAGADGSRVPAGPVWEHIDALLGRGWTKVAIARAIGQAGPGLQIGREAVTRRNANAIRALLTQPVPSRRDSHGNVTPARLVEDPDPGPDEIAEAGRSHDSVILRLAEVLEVRIDQAEWRQHAACRGRPVWMWFPARGDLETLDRALRICQSCLVREQCAEAHIHEPDGVFGGMTARGRRRLRVAS